MNELSEDVKDVTIRKQGEYIRLLQNKICDLEKTIKKLENEVADARFDRDTYQTMLICNERRYQNGDKR